MRILYRSPLATPFSSHHHPSSVACCERIFLDWLTLLSHISTSHPPALYLCGIQHSLYPLLRRKTPILRNGDAVSLSWRHVYHRHIKNTIFIYLEGNLNLRWSAWCKWNAQQLEVAWQVVVTRHRTHAHPCTPTLTHSIDCLNTSRISTPSFSESLHCALSTSAPRLVRLTPPRAAPNPVPSTTRHQSD